MLLRFGVMLMWFLHFLPVRAIGAIGQALGMLAYLFGQARVTRTNLSACFPELSEREQAALARRHFRAVGRSFLELGILWWSPAERIKRLVRVEGAENYLRVKGKRPVIGFAPHFVGIDMGAVRLAIDFEGAAIYSRQKNAGINELLLKSRTRFKPITMIARQDGLRPALKALKRGLALYVLPDMDFGERDSIFVPFFGVQAATVPILSRLAKHADAVVIPVITQQLAGGAGYVVKIYPAWEAFPSGDVQADTRHMNAFLEARVREMPEQYFWIHKRFRTRPPSETRKFYGT
jgi:Kdo2-lipid IVA lauroyltransferase/acyltransferase